MQASAQTATPILKDSWFVLKMENFSLYGVFDGHGQKGHDVSNFAMDMLPKCIIKDNKGQRAEPGSLVWGLVLLGDRPSKNPMSFLIIPSIMSPS